MINKKNLWFLTLFCLILVLSVYYVTMPSELLMTNNSDYINATIKEDDSVIEEPVVSVNESSILTALRIEAEEQISNEIEELQAILVNADATVDEKNNAYEKIKNINNIRTEEENIENQLLSVYDLKTFVKINGDQIRVVVSSENHDNSLANNIIRTVQGNYEQNKYISVKFQV